MHDCLDKDCAFPAMLYCFSTIDLFGALHSGHAESGSHTEANFKNYAIHFMKNTGTKYTSEQTDLLQNIFRHKVTHLAQPKLVINHRNKLFAWRYEYPDILNHLKIEQRPRTQIRNILTPKPMYYDHIFSISITKLLSDIIDSVIREPDGYMEPDGPSKKLGRHRPEWHCLDHPTAIVNAIETETLKEDPDLK